MTDDYSRRKIQVIREFLEAEFKPPYTVTSVLAQRDPLADTKFKIVLDNTVACTLTVCPAIVLDSHPTPDQLKALLVSQGIMAKIKSSVDTRICHEDLGTDETQHAKPLRSVRGVS
jgi:hypothetical protein